MKDSQKSRQQLIAELNEARRRLKKLATAETKRNKADQKPKQSADKFYKAYHLHQRRQIP
jgi:hypothetical protein